VADQGNTLLAGTGDPGGLRELLKGESRPIRGNAETNLRTPEVVEIVLSQASVVQGGTDPQLSG